jgi:hypothetical protein
MKDAKYYRDYYWNNIEKSRGRSRESNKMIRRNIRSEVLKILGGKCARCGIKDPRVLQVDHIEGNGHKDMMNKWKNRRYDFFKHIIKNPDFTKYQLLCANCNWIKKFEMNEIGIVGRPRGRIKD